MPPHFTTALVTVPHVLVQNITTVSTVKTSLLNVVRYTWHTINKHYNNYMSGFIDIDSSSAVTVVYSTCDGVGDVSGGK